MPPRTSNLTLCLAAILCFLAALLYAPPLGQAVDADATQPATSANATAPALLPIPDAASQSEGLSLLKRVFKEEYTQHAPEQRVALAKMLLQQGVLEKTQPPMRYVMLHEAIELASNAGETDMACQAIDTLAKTFAIDALELKVRAMTQATASANNVAQWEEIVNTGLPLLDIAIRDERFALGQKIAQLSDAAALKSEHVDLVTATQLRTADFHTVMTACTTAQAAAGALLKTPLDGPANLSVGIYTCFVRSDWAGGLMNLAQGSDEALKTVAVKEIVGQQDPIRQLELADRWWDAGESYKGWMQREIRSHAAEWYNTALKNLNGVTLARINKRITLGGDAATEPREKTVDLLATLDPAKDAVEGTWKMSGGVLASDDSKHARIAFPYQPPDEYDFRIEFSRGADKNSMVALLAQGSSAFGWAMGVQNNRICRFETVNKRIHEGNPTEVKFQMQSDHKYILEIQVRKEGVKALVDGKVIDEYKTDYKDLSRYMVWKLPNEKLLGIGASDGAIQVYSAEVVEINGEGKKMR